ncbi:DUF1828 domain-containing protein [Massilia agri]|uniref:DUF1828 domain-containing protein n=1 Tax=Massilia agri TaxID=1886785 RepID=A0ABT2ATJ5_9BURK|nr:DUF1828 domain-containing protein [Massilia agri]MCS0599575.1 DUF1828 domain-containing protein [Massilia agri]
MLNCNWANALTRYDCRQVRGLNGSIGLEIGTPFSLPGGAAINLYLMPVGDHVVISDNGDTLMHLSGLGIDVWKPSRIRSLREEMSSHAMTLTDDGDFRLISSQEKSAWNFANAVSSLLAVNHWALQQLKAAPNEHDLPAEAEAYIVARDPSAYFEKNPKVKGASRAEHRFDFQHGDDLIDVITPHGISTGMSMRKVGDVINGPFVGQRSPLIIVDDRFDPIRAESEMGMISSIARTQPFSSLTRALH